jgi:hypothetical protein
MSVPAADETFAVYIAGEQVDGTDLGMTYIYAITPLGPVRMTSGEADELGQKLSAAAAAHRKIEKGTDR